MNIGVIRFQTESLSARKDMLLILIKEHCWSTKLNVVYQKVEINKLTLTQEKWYTFLTRSIFLTAETLAFVRDNL